MASRGILLGENGVEIINGITQMGNTTKQEVDILLRSSQGEFKQDPVLGPNVVRKIRSTSLTDLNRSIRLNLQRDNKIVNNVQLSVGKIKVNIDE